MSDPITVQLGEFVFERTEIPEEITFGGAQKLVVHRLVGGERVVDSLGRDDMPLSWSGLLFGTDALGRARFLDSLRIKGEPLTLTWSKLRYRVVVSQFFATYEYNWQIPYRIKCEVVKDEAALVTKIPVTEVITETGAGLDEAVRGDLESAMEVAEDIEDSILDEALDAVDSALETVSDIATAAQEKIQAVLKPLAAAQQRVVALISQAGNTVARISTLGGILPSNTISQNALALTGQATGFLTQGKLYEARSILGRMDTALSTAAGLGSAVNTIKKSGGDLFTTAKDLYGDATKWAGLAEANDLDDPMIEGTQELKVPVNPGDSGGIPGGG